MSACPAKERKMLFPILDFIDKRDGGLIEYKALNKKEYDYVINYKDLVFHGGRHNNLSLTDLGRDKLKKFRGS